MLEITPRTHSDYQIFPLAHTPITGHKEACLKDRTEQALVTGSVLNS